MGAETALSFLRILEQGRPLPSVFVICGPQAFLREYVLHALRSELTRRGRSCRSFQVGTSGSFDAVLDELRAGDLFASKKVVVCRIPRARRGSESDSDAESESRPGTKSGERALAEAIERRTFAGEIILAYERDSAPAAIRRAVERAGVIVNCMRPFDNQLGQYAQAFAQALELKLAAGSSDVLVSRYSSDLPAMANAIAKAALYRDKGDRLTPDDLADPGTAHTPEPFELADSLARGQTVVTLAMLDRAIALGRDVFEVLAVEIIPLIRRMMVAAAIVEKGGATVDVGAALGFGPTSSLTSRAIEGARRFGLERLRRAHQRVCELDAGFKMGLLREREAALSQALVELMAP
jgi:DNA polymerase III delta subunit